MSTSLEIILALFFVTIVASSLHPAIKTALATIVAVLLIGVAITRPDDERHR
jgi:hypothetical protein